MCIKVQPVYTVCGHPADPTSSQKISSKGGPHLIDVGRNTLVWYSFCQDAIKKANAQLYGCPTQPCLESEAYVPLQTALKGICPTCNLVPTNMKTQELEKYERERRQPELAEVLKGPHKLIRRKEEGVVRYFVVPLRTEGVKFTKPLVPLPTPSSKVSTQRNGLYARTSPMKSSTARRVIFSQSQQTPQHRPRWPAHPNSANEDDCDDWEIELESDSENDELGRFSGLRGRPGDDF